MPSLVGSEMCIRDSPNPIAIDQGGTEQTYDRGVTFADDAQKPNEHTQNQTGVEEEQGASEQARQCAGLASASMQPTLSTPIQTVQTSALVSQTNQPSESELFQAPVGLMQVDPIHPNRAELPGETWPPQHPTAQPNFRTDAPWPIRTSTPTLAGQGSAVGNQERGRVNTLANIAAKANPLTDATNQQAYEQQLLFTPLRTCLLYTSPSPRD